jgi:hypothetical protein
MNKEVVLGLTRHLLTTAGGVMAASYGVDGPTLEAVLGAVLTLVGFAWSVLDKQSSGWRVKDAQPKV